MRTGKRKFLAAQLIAVLIPLSACSSNAGDAEPERSSDDWGTDEWTSRAETFTSLTQLTRASSLVVAGEFEGNLKPNPFYGNADAPFVIGDFAVEESILGRAGLGSTVELSLEGSIDADGSAHTSKLEVGKDYLLYLTPQGPKSPAVFTVVGYTAGMYEQSSSDTFLRVDEESPRLPAVLSLDEAREALGRVSGS